MLGDTGGKAIYLKVVYKVASIMRFQHTTKPSRAGAVGRPRSDEYHHYIGRTN